MTESILQIKDLKSPLGTMRFSKASPWILNKVKSLLSWVPQVVGNRPCYVASMAWR